MTNEELKKKIESIIRNAKRDFAYCVPEEWAVKVLADALIAAGIGDVKAMKEIKYCVRRAEKALYIACRETAEIIFKDDFDRHAQEYMYGYLKQAEKELVEENNDNKINDITWTFDLVKGTDSNLLFDNEFTYGITCYNDMHVYVSKDLPIELRKRTLTHEMVHAVLFSHMLRKYESFTEEEMADFVAKYFDTICILRDTIMNEWKNESH